MNTLQLINYIASNPQFNVVVIGGNDDKTPMQAIEYLSGYDGGEIYSINSSLKKGVLLCYEIH